MNVATAPETTITVDPLTLVAAMPGRPYEDEREEGVGAFRGLFFGAVFGLGAWAVIGLGVWAIVAAVTAG